MQQGDTARDLYTHPRRLKGTCACDVLRHTYSYTLYQALGFDLQDVADVPIYGRIASLQLFRPAVSSKTGAKLAVTCVWTESECEASCAGR